jgi:arsenite-transporting ATPase
MTTPTDAESSEDRRAASIEPFVFFGGKGGVGKTTVSCAYARKCADAGVRTLVVSTDPAHSVSDVFDQSFGDEPAPVDGI